MKALHYTPAERSQLPETPGVYQFYNSKAQLIYVGKAKNLKKRVASYFNEGLHLVKTRKMAAQIASIRFIVVDNEYEALLLENNLIKAAQPRYNTLLKDGKTYPYLCILEERFPRVVATRQREPALGRYFGPFTSTKQMAQIQELIHQLYPIRTCSYLLTPQNIAKKKFRVCLEYHLGRCLGPCEGLQPEADYQRNIEEIAQLLKGNFAAIKKALKQRMLQAATENKFLQAHRYKEQLQAVEHYQARSLVAHPSIGEVDVIVLRPQEKQAYVHYMRISQGMVVFAQTIEVQPKLEETDSNLLARAFCHFHEKTHSTATQVLSNLTIPGIATTFTVVVPKIGDKKKLVEMALKNTLFFQQEALNKRAQKKQSAQARLLLLQRDLRMDRPPLYIECFDNSNLQGTHPVSSLVCFKNGKPAKRSYRHYHLRAVAGIDDYASMQEVVRRRYQQLEAPLPDLIIVDGGKGQLNAAVAVLKELKLYGKTAIISIAKRLEAIYYPGDTDPLYLSKDSPALQLLQTIRDEAHRFALAFHRKVRGKAMTRSQLEGIPTIGPKTIQKLLDYFGSVSAVAAASEEALTNLLGSRKAQLLYDRLHPPRHP